jgi:hypothetical protein
MDFWGRLQHLVIPTNLSVATWLARCFPTHLSTVRTALSSVKWGWVLDPLCGKGLSFGRLMDVCIPFHAFWCYCIKVIWTQQAMCIENWFRTFVAMLSVSIESRTSRTDRIPHRRNLYCLKAMNTTVEEWWNQLPLRDILQTPNKPILEESVLSSDVSRV